MHRSSLLEVPVIKGSMKFRSMVGFADVVASLVKEELAPCTVVRWQDKVKVFDKTLMWRSVGTDHLLFEVKSKPVPASSILRQMKLYLEYMPESIDVRFAHIVMVAATLYPMSASDRAMLKSQGVHTIRLGEPFQRWLAEQRNASADDAPEVEL